MLYHNKNSERRHRNGELCSISCKFSVRNLLNVISHYGICEEAKLPYPDSTGGEIALIIARTGKY